ncbi:MAG: bifunctional folylpolyglutamate synthase/dihydrofolate synthase [Alphaproteobacteria bacterium]|nr:bifunctional folylpolyglutamate synthase/dihydrofolate synthase [Alphaproteobacteria bacterium]
MTAPTSDRVLERLGRLHPKLIDLSLGRIERLLAALGDPQDDLPPVVHVAGTKGKGSTVATMRACLEAAGYQVHAYISPHLVRFHERIRLAGQLIGEEALIALLEECERANKDAPITFFEITTAAAFLAFVRTPADIVLLEVGLGGRLDATNVVRRPAVTAVTPVSLDHQAFLGNTVAAIAGEKAGILKPGVTAVIAPQLREAEAVIEARAEALSAALYRARHEWRCEVFGSGMRYEGEHWQFDLPLPSLMGAHQIINAGTAIACLERLSGFDIPKEAVADGLRHIDWPARLQLLRRGPLVDAVPPCWELWLDGGHNPLAGEILGDVAAGWHDRPLYLVVGMMNTKDSAGFIRPMAKHARALWAVTIPGEKNALPAEAIAAAAGSAGLPAQTAASVLAAIRDIPVHDGNGRVLICGSLYFAGKVLAENG